MSSDRQDHGIQDDLVEQVIAAHDLDPTQRQAVRDAVRLVIARFPTGPIDRGGLLTIPYTGDIEDTDRAEPTLAPFTDSGTHPEPTPTPRRPQGDEDLVPVGLLGQGGMGEVHRARDARLDRHLAMKLLHARLSDDRRMRARFLAEAAVTAQLAHPGIPPVHALGESGDGRPYFTMKEVHGRTLGDVIREFHRPGGAEGLTESRLLDVFHKVCDAVAYAHSRGVIHCDLKPANIMVGAFGEVLVMDWGVARLVRPTSTHTASEPPVSSQWADASDTESTVAGTPAYMPPEQAMGEIDQLGPHSDVFALGVILYELLTGQRPFRGDALRMVRAITLGQIPAMEARPGSLLDEGLEQIIHKALAAAPADRFRDAGALSDAFGQWKEGSLRREAALKVVRRAQGMLPDVEPKRERARALRELAEQRLATLDPDAGVEHKSAAWSLQEEADTLEVQSAMRVAEVMQLLHGALAHSPDLPEAKRLLAQIHFEQHQDAERRRAHADAVRHETLLRAYDVGEYSEYLAGTASLTLVTEPACEAILHLYVRQNRRMAVQKVQSLGKTPLIDIELPIGSYLVELRAPDRPPAWYPVSLRRLEQWNGVPPGESAPLPIRIPTRGEIAEDEAWVPAGWTRIGGDPEAPGSARETRVWVDAFAIKRTQVTAHEVFGWLRDHPDADARREMLRATGGLWRGSWPAVGASWNTARQYARAQAERTGVRWRLPTEVEWEKTARGVDGRLFPWGDFADEAFCHARAGRRLPRMPAPVTHFPEDTSPYGVRGMGGNAREWCLDAFRPGAPQSGAGRRAEVPRFDPDETVRAVRGGSWRQPLELARSAARVGMRASEGHGDVAFRLVRTLDP